MGHLARFRWTGSALSVSHSARWRWGHCRGVLSSSICADVDECQTGTHRCAGGQICHNLPGSYRCDCQTGYQYDALRQVCTGTCLRVRPEKWWWADWSCPGGRKHLSASAEPQSQRVARFDCMSCYHVEKCPGPQAPEKVDCLKSLKVFLYFKWDTLRNVLQECALNII